MLNTMMSGEVLTFRSATINITLVTNTANPATIENRANIANRFRTEISHTYIRLDYYKSEWRAGELIPPCLLPT